MQHESFEERKETEWANSRWAAEKAKADLEEIIVQTIARMNGISMEEACRPRNNHLQEVRERNVMESLEFSCAENCP